MADKRIHLLVHAGAPSSRRDDSRYAAQAEAYANLRDSRVRRLQDDRLSAKAMPPTTRTGQGRNTIAKPINSATGPESTIYVEDTQMAYTALESQLRSSAPAVVRQTPARSHKGSSRDAVTANTPSRSASRVSQSSYLVSPQLERSKQIKRINGYEQVQKLPRLVRKPLEEANNGHSETNPADGSDKENSAQDGTVESTSELPTSYSLSEGASARSIERPRLPEKSVSDPGVLVALEQTSTRHVPSVSPRKAETTGRGDAPENQKSKASAVVSSKRPRISTGFSDSELEILNTLPSQILPPGPETSMARFTTHVTPALQHLIDQSAVAAAFNPISQTRQLEVSERGYWLVLCQQWPVSEQIAFWNSMEKAIANAGWGVWCSRLDKTEDGFSTAAGAAPQSHPYGSVRVFCWGEVVKHVYLLLYVASKSKVRRLGLQWIDSDGHVVVQMRQ